MMVKYIEIRPMATRPVPLLLRQRQMTINHQSEYAQYYSRYHQHSTLINLPIIFQIPGIPLRVLEVAKELELRQKH